MDSTVRQITSDVQEDTDDDVDVTLDIYMGDESFTPAVFLIHLYSIVNDARYQNIISWNPDIIPSGDQSFIIMDQQKLCDEVMPLYFQSHKISGFKRNLNKYGFKMVQKR